MQDSEGHGMEFALHCKCSGKLLEVLSRGMIDPTCDMTSLLLQCGGSLKRHGSRENR